MMHRASLKLGLDKAVLGRMTQASDKKQEANNTKDVETLLKKGAYHVFMGADYQQAVLSETDIDAILDGERASTILQFEKVKAVLEPRTAKPSLALLT